MALEWTYEEDLVVDKDSWHKVFDEKTHKLIQKQYVSYFVNELNKYENITCALISRGCYFAKKGITIRFICKHKTCDRKYNVVNNNLDSERKVFQVKHTGEICHVQQISRSRDYRFPKKKPNTSFHCISFTNINSAVVSHQNLPNEQYSETVENIKEEFVIDENVYDYG